MDDGISSQMDLRMDRRQFWARAGAWALLAAGERFTAVGDERGLLLVMKRGRNLGFTEPKPADCFATVARVQGARPARYAFPDFPYEILSGA